MINPFYNPETKKIEFNLQPIRDVVFLYQEEAPEKIGLFYIPDMYRINHQNSIAVVLAVGNGYYDYKKKKFVNTVLKQGDIVLFDGGIPWQYKIKNWQGVEYEIKIAGERDIQGIINEYN